MSPLWFADQIFDEALVGHVGYIGYCRDFFVLWYGPEFFVISNFFGCKRVQKRFQFIVLHKKGSLFERNAVQCRPGLNLREHFDKLWRSFDFACEEKRVFDIDHSAPASNEATAAALEIEFFVERLEAVCGQAS